jgi:hypothetical protein
MSKRCGLNSPAIIWTLLPANNRILTMNLLFCSRNFHSRPKSHRAPSFVAFSVIYSFLLLFFVLMNSFVSRSRPSFHISHFHFCFTVISIPAFVRLFIHYRGRNFFSRSSVATQFFINHFHFIFIMHVTGEKLLEENSGVSLEPEAVELKLL